MKHLVALVAFMMWIPVPVLGQGGPGVFLEPKALTAAPQDDAGVLRSRIVTIDFDLLEAARDAAGPASRAPSKRSSTRCAVPTRYEGRRLAILTRREQIKRTTLQQRRRENLHTQLRAVNRQEVSLRKQTHWPTSV